MRRPVGLMVRRRRVADELRRIRQQSELSGEAVAERMHWSPSKVSRIERFQTGISLFDLKRLVELYRTRNQVPGARLDELVRYAGAAAERGNLPVGDRDDREEVTTVLEWGVLTVPELLRTREYAKAVLVSTQASTRLLPREIRSSVDDTAVWQLRLSDEKPLALQAVLDESVLHRRYGSGEVMRAQLEHLLRVSALANVEVRVVPLSHGGASAPGGFRYLRFDALGGSDLDLPDAVVLERLGGSERLDDEDVTYPYYLAFQQLWAAAASQVETTKLIRAALHMK